MRIRLDDLVQPLGRERFLVEHVLAEQPFLSQPNPALVAQLRSLEAFTSPEALVARLTRPVGLMGADYFRGQVAPEQALDWMARGYTLYVHALEEELPEVRALTTELASELGAANLGIVVEAFVAKAGNLSTLHYDHDLNFQVLLEGEKRWRVAPNTNIANPMRSFHPTRRPDGGFTGFAEEVYAHDRGIAIAMPADARVYDARPGSTMFVPRSWWHEVVAETACFGVNFVLKGTTWASGLTTALADLLLGDADARAFCFGSFTGVAALEQAAVQRFTAVRDRAIRLLADLTLDEVYFGGKAATFQWSAAAADRAIVDNALVVPGISAEPMPLDRALVGLLGKLVALRCPFRWEHLVVLCQDEIRGDIGAAGLWNVLAELAEAGYLERLPTAPT